LPLLSGLTRLESPARLLLAGLESRMPAVLTPDGRPVPVALLTLSNGDAQSAGTIFVDRLVVRAADRALVAQAVGLSASRLEAYVDGTLWARSADLSPDSSLARLEAVAPLQLGPGASAVLELRMVPRTDAQAPFVRLGCDRADIGVVQPASALLTVAVQPEQGQTFPLWSEAGGLTPADLRQSYSNFPNPFAAGREVTTIVYYLRNQAQVSLRIYDARGEDVLTVLDGVARGAGLHQEDRWDGRNGRGETVRNGVYAAELTVRYDDGSSERLLRKLAVVR
jgi:hypothetical protein